jgi:hypothetical protein
VIPIRRLFCCFAAFTALALNAPVRAGVLPDDFTRHLTAGAHYSLSRQFVVYDEDQAGWLPSTIDEANVVRLEPNLLTVSCERIKRALMKELGIHVDQWQGQITIQLHPAENLDEQIPLTSTVSDTGWAYRMDMPDAMEQRRLVLAITQVLLLEIANRQSSGQSAEIPAWLVQGLTQQVMRDREQQLVLSPPDKMEAGVSVARLERSERLTNSLAEAHSEFQVRAPLTVEELSWPSDDQFQGDAGVAYRCSAQLLVCELVGLQNGRSRLRDFIADLPGHLNWQLAFLQAFHDDFPTQRDFDKWWALRVATFTGRDLSQMLSATESWEKLEEVVHAPVEVRAATNDLPLRTEVNLQTMLQDLDYTGQTTLIREKLRDLMILRLQVTPEFVPFVEGYRQILEGHIERSQSAGYVPLVKGSNTPTSAVVLRETIRELDALDARLEAMRPAPESAGGEPAGDGASNTSR